MDEHMGVTRQDAETELHELVGRTCDQLVFVPADEEIVVFYACSDGVWHRFFLEGGLLFWREGPRPDSEGDHDSEESYIDLAAELNLGGASFSAISFREGILELSFSNGGLV